MITECGACQFPDIECTPTRVYNSEEHEALYCDVCRSTLISTLSRSGHPDSPVLMTIGYCTNLILKAIKDKA